MQDNSFWSMNMNPYKFGPSGYGNTSFYCPYEVNDNLPRVDASRRGWVYPTSSTICVEEPTVVASREGENAMMAGDAIIEESK